MHFITNSEHARLGAKWTLPVLSTHLHWCQYRLVTLSILSCQRSCLRVFTVRWRGQVNQQMFIATPYIEIKIFKISLTIFGCLSEHTWKPGHQPWTVHIHTSGWAAYPNESKCVYVIVITGGYRNLLWGAQSWRTRSVSIYEVWGRSPQYGQGPSLWWGVRGLRPLEADDIFALLDYICEVILTLLHDSVVFVNVPKTGN